RSNPFPTISQHRQEERRLKAARPVQAQAATSCRFACISTSCTSCGPSPCFLYPQYRIGSRSYAADQSPSLFCLRGLIRPLFPQESMCISSADNYNIFIIEKVTELACIEIKL